MAQGYRKRKILNHDKPGYCYSEKTDKELETELREKATKDKLREANIPMYSVKLEFSFERSRLLRPKRLDIDNSVKDTLDILKKAGVFPDDSLVYNVEATKIPLPPNEKKELTHIEVWEWCFE
jgi:Holliday junction resolvase RusA-like endonuclease